VPIISVIGRKQPKLRAVILALYILLTVGAVTMVYPFWLMVSMSFASYTDQNDLSMIPRYWRDEAALFRKYEESKYNESPDYFNQFLQSEMPSFKDLEPPKKVNATAVQDWQEFAKGLPAECADLGHQETTSQITPESRAIYRRFLQIRFHGDLEAMNQAYGEVNSGWTDANVRYPMDRWEERQQQASDSRKYREFLEFKMELPARYRIPVSMDGMWWKWLITRYGTDLEELGRRHGCVYASNAAVHLPAQLPAQAKLAEDWVEFLRRECPLHYIALDAAAEPAFHAALRGRYGDLAAFNREHRTSYADWAQVKLSPTVPKAEAWRVDWMEFVTTTAPPQFVRLDTPETRYRAWLARKYRSFATLNRAYGTTYASFAEVIAPRLESDWVEMLADVGAIRREFAVRNYREVLQVIALHGRAVWNTFVLVLATVLVTLIVNPLAAYALSRYQLPATYKILLFLLATMAFPAEVTMIPNFLLLKGAHLLNTYWALILPGMASGMSIFILKGFFDSLPRELYEAAQIDGAREATMFLRITMPLSMPVLAVIGLGAFTLAYGGYMWAFLVCQDPKMWTVMVWLIQMESWAPQFLRMASLVLTAIPTLLVFIFCQNIIMRGIILPVEK
jgi:ABC-type glycerol-3-phosphate transport system permease component